MKRKPRPDNFRLLDPDAAQTKNIIAACLAVMSPLPWKPEYEARYDPPLLAVLAERIAARAAQGKTVHLTPATADRRWRAAAGC
jgi:hypothetical protein